MLWGVTKIFTDPAWVQGLGSLLAVIVAIAIAFDQRAASERRNREAQLSEHRADRALLTFALNNMRSYASKCIKGLGDALAGRTGDQAFIPSTWRTPILPQRSLRDVAKCVATSPHATAANALSELLKTTQIQNARIERLEEKAGSYMTSYELAGHLAFACRLAAQIDKCFDYARFKSDRVNALVVADDVERVARQDGIDRDDSVYEPLFFVIKHKAF